MNTNVGFMTNNKDHDESQSQHKTNLEVKNMTINRSNSAQPLVSTANADISSDAKAADKAECPLIRAATETPDIVVLSKLRKKKKKKVKRVKTSERLHEEQNLFAQDDVFVRDPYSILSTFEKKEHPRV